MYAVVQFIEHNRFQVLAVPTSWIRSNTLLWPKLLSNEKIDKMRREGVTYSGSTKDIPVIISKKFKRFESAEAAAEALTKRDVSDIDGKKRKLAKKPRPMPTKNYDALCEELAIPGRSSADCCDNQKKDAPRRIDLTNLGAAKAYELALVHVSPEPADHVDGREFQSMQETQPANENDVQSIVAPPISQELKPLLAALPPNPVETSEVLPTVVIQQGTPVIHQSAPVYYTDQNNELIYIGNSSPIDDGSLKSEMHNLKEEMKNLKCEVTNMMFEISKFKDNVEEIISNCFQENFAKFASITELQRKQVNTKPENEILVENHTLISSEEQLMEWNVKLANEDLHQNYLDYFSKIISPNSYTERADNACYIVVDCLFTRPFWNLFTWTGINRGNKSKRGFREFGNVTQLIVSIVRIGDPFYNVQKMETFCRTRLFRYSKARSSKPQLRKSACRPGRKQPKQTVQSDQNGVANDNAAEQILEKESNNGILVKLDEEDTNEEEENASGLSDIEDQDKPNDECDKVAAVDDDNSVDSIEINVASDYSSSESSE